MHNLSKDRYRLFQLAVGPVETNCYIYGSIDSNEVLIIDPGSEPEKIKDLVERNGLKPKAIVNTHGHIDHIGGNHAFDLPVYIHEGDSEFLINPTLSLSALYPGSVPSQKASRILTDGDEVAIEGVSLKVIHTPGHTPGGISMHSEEIIFTGDTLFYRSIGRTDFPYGDSDAIIRSIKEKLMVFNDNTLVFPGHGESTTIGQERAENPWL